MFGILGESTQFVWHSHFDDVLIYRNTITEWHQIAEVNDKSVQCYANFIMYCSSLLVRIFKCKSIDIVVWPLCLKRIKILMNVTKYASPPVTCTRTANRNALYGNN